MPLSRSRVRRGDPIRKPLRSGLAACQPVSPRGRRRADTATGACQIMSNGRRPSGSQPPAAVATPPPARSCSGSARCRQMSPPSPTGPGNHRESAVRASGWSRPRGPSAPTLNHATARPPCPNVTQLDVDGAGVISARAARAGLVATRQ